MNVEQFQNAKNIVRSLYDTWVLGSIRRTYEATKGEEDGTTPLAAFILVSCAIDFLAGFFCGIESFSPKPGESSNNYKDFVKEYLPQYEPEDIYKNVRCRLAHNYTIGGEVGLTHESRALHDPKGRKGAKIINFEDFFEDFTKAADKYFADLAFDSSLQANFEKRAALGIATEVTI
jgi:hypothetical protein